MVVEDELALAQAVVEHLRAAGHAVDHVATLGDGQAAERAVPYDVILLDMHLPDGQGIDLLRAIRNRGAETPVIILTAQDRIMQRIAGLEAGADDYMVKPYDLNEMLARIAAIRRRADQNHKPERVFGDLQINPVKQTVNIGGNAVSLTPKEWAILDRISRRPDTITSRSDLEEALYGFGDSIDSNAIEAHISRLRIKLGRSAIETVRGFGYRIGLK